MAKDNKSLIDKREFVRRYMEPAMRLDKEDENDPVPEILELLKRGEAEEVINRFDPEAKGSLTEPRAFLGLIHAYVQKGKLGRAKELADMAIEFYRSKGNKDKQAVAMVQLARVVWREDGLEGAIDILDKALVIYPECRSARANRICYASIERRDDLLKRYLDELFVSVPDFHTDEFYRRFFIEDAQIGYLRSLELYERVARRISEAN